MPEPVPKSADTGPAVPVTVPEPVLSITVQLAEEFQNELALLGDVAVPVNDGTSVAPELSAMEPVVPTRIWSKFVPAPLVVKLLSSQV